MKITNLFCYCDCRSNPPAVNGIEINKDILSPDQKRYIDDEMPHLQKFIDDSAAFQIKAYNFLQDFAEIAEKEDIVARLLQDALEQTTIINGFEKCFF